jgi:Mce-associated membrane protein
VEDQPTDSSDLTADTTAAVPRGKAAHNRHRLPRQKAQQFGEADAADEAGTDAAETTSEPTDATEAVELTKPSAESSEADTSETAWVETPKRRRRIPWRRDRTAADAPSVSPPVEEAVEVAVEEAEVSDDAPEPETVEESAEPVLIAHRPAGRALKLLAVVAGVLFVSAAAFAGATIQPYLADRAAVQTKFLIAETAANAITTLWTYTPDDMDKLPDRSARYLGGDFAADYKRYIDAIVAPNKQAQVTNNTQVLGAAVESLTPTDATAIVYTNSVATSPVTKGIPSLRYLSYRLTMKRQDNRWLITQMVAVTKLDLTPRL